MRETIVILFQRSVSPIMHIDSDVLETFAMVAGPVKLGEKGEKTV
jgi:hypothetical protein